jgi:hypothetical protein
MQERCEEIILLIDQQVGDAKASLSKTGVGPASFNGISLRILLERTSNGLTKDEALSVAKYLEDQVLTMSN